MIFVHRYMIGTNENKKERVRLWETRSQAMAQHRVLGGSVQAFESVENIESEYAEREHIKELVIDEVTCLIDDLTTDAPGSPRNYEPGSAEWDSWKVKTLNNLRNILDGKFNEI